QRLFLRSRVTGHWLVARRKNQRRVERLRGNFAVELDRLLGAHASVHLCSLLQPDLSHRVDPARHFAAGSEDYIAIGGQRLHLHTGTGLDLAAAVDLAEKYGVVGELQIAIAAEQLVMLDI